MPSVREGRAVRPSLFVFGAALLLLAASLLAGEAYRWVAIALLVLACAPWRALPANALTALAGLFCAWQLANALLVSPAYQSEVLYRPVILFCAFAAFAALSRDDAIRQFRAGVVLLALLVLLGLLQHFFGAWTLSHNPLRAAATFITPNTFAAAINLFLLPLAASYLAGNRAPRIYWAVLWLFAGLVATQSRGGMLALFAGLLFVAICLGWPGIRRAANPAARLLGGCAAVWLLVVVAAGLLAPGSEGQAPSLETWTGRVTWDRAEIYATTFGLILEHPWAGAGAGMFWPLFEPVKPEIFGDHTFTFAHSDYLQFWLEYGAPGLALFVALGGAALFMARSAWRRAQADALPLACGAALASCFAHAMVDFPFYVPFILLVAGAVLGALASHCGDSAGSGAWRRLSAQAGTLATPLLRWLLVIAALAWLAQPMLAQLAARRALDVMSAGELPGGLYWQSVARRLEPRNGSHYWAEAVIWREMAIDTGNRAHWGKVDTLLVDGIRANPPHRFTLQLERARLHRRYGRHLERPASPAEILAWVEDALARAPGSFEGQLERARALEHAGRGEEARRAARGLLERRPDSPLARRLVDDLK